MTRLLLFFCVGVPCWLLLSRGATGQTLPASHALTQPLTRPASASAPASMPAWALESPEALLAHLEAAPKPPDFSNVDISEQRAVRAAFAELSDAWWLANEPSGREVSWTLQFLGLGGSTVSKQMILQLQSQQQRIRVLATIEGAAALPKLNAGDLVKVKGLIRNAPHDAAAQDKTITLAIKTVALVKASSSPASPPK